MYCPNCICFVFVYFLNKTKTRTDLDDTIGSTEFLKNIFFLFGSSRLRINSYFFVLGSPSSAAGAERGVCFFGSARFRAASCSSVLVRVSPR